jgi:hypothetical protein
MLKHFMYPCKEGLFRPVASSKHSPSCQRNKESDEQDILAQRRVYPSLLTCIAMSCPFAGVPKAVAKSQVMYLFPSVEPLTGCKKQGLLTSLLYVLHRAHPKRRMCDALCKVANMFLVTADLVTDLLVDEVRGYC